MSAFSAASFPAIWLSRKRSGGNMIMPMHIGQQHHYVGSSTSTCRGFIGSRLGSPDSNPDQEKVDGSLSMSLLDPVNP
jgi:hypothetical protein